MQCMSSRGPGEPSLLAYGIHAQIASRTGVAHGGQTLAGGYAVLNQYDIAYW